MKKSLMIILLLCGYVIAMEEAMGETKEWTKVEWSQYIQRMNQQLDEKVKHRTSRLEKKRLWESYSRLVEIERAKSIVESCLGSAISRNDIHTWFGPNFAQECVERGVVERIDRILAVAKLWHARESLMDVNQYVINNNGDLLPAILEYFKKDELRSTSESQGPSTSESSDESYEEFDDSGEGNECHLVPVVQLDEEES